MPITSPANSAASSDIPSGTRRSVRFARGTSTCSACAPCSEPERRAVTEDPRLVALVVLAAHAEEARSARGLEAAEHAIAHVDLRDRVAGGDHLADVLVPDREPGLDLHAPVVDVQVRPADAGRLDLHDRVVGCEQLGLGPVLEAHLAGRLEGDGLSSTVAVLRGARAPR